MKNRFYWPLCLLTFLSSQFASGQSDKNPCLYKSLLREKTCEPLLARYQTLYQLRPNEIIASVGAGGGNKEIMYSMLADSLVFYLQDIDSTCLAKTTLQTTIRQVYEAANRICNDTFIPVFGTEVDTNLPNHRFDKVLLENTLHELSKPDAILKSICSSLKPDGFLFIEDFIAQRQGQTHRGCGKRLFTEADLIQLLADNGFQLVEVNEVYPKNNVDKLYKFRRAN